MGDPGLLPSATLVAAVDLGTNAFRLLIAELNDGVVVPRCVHRLIPRLGEGVGQTGRLSPAAIDRAVAALHEIRAVIDRYPVAWLIAVATSAVRDASNAKEFLERVTAEVGIAVEVISGDEEARRTWLGVRAGYRNSPPIDHAVVVDIGGGSTEIIHVQGGTLVRTQSLNLGVVKLTERYVRHDPPRPDELAALDAAVRDALDAVADRSPARGCAVIGTAGTVSTAAALHLNLSTYEPARIHDARVPRAAVESIARRLSGLSSAERRRLPTLERGREDVIVAGLAILRRILDVCGADEVRVSEYGLREGLIVDWVERRHASPQRR